VVPEAAELLARAGAGPGSVVTGELAHNRWLSPGVWEVRTGTGERAVLKYSRSDRSRGQTPWDAHWTARDGDPRRWTYWCREPLAYQEHLADAYADSGITAPACLGAQVDDTEAVLLLEWADGIPGEDWHVELFAPAAAALGRAQARYLTGGLLPDPGWLSRNFLREYSSEKPVDYGLLDDDDAWQHPVARATFPAGLRDGVRYVHAHAQQLYRISESLPRTLCHLDFWPKNLFRRPDGQIVLIDWSFLGAGAIGEDIGNIVPDSVLDHFLAADDLPALEDAVYAGYLGGLHDAGWRGDERLVRLGMWSSSVKYDWLGPLTLAQVGQEKQYRYGGGGEIDATFKFTERGRVLLNNSRWARQAIELADRLGIT
jgi:hypothetical protein